MNIMPLFKKIGHCAYECKKKQHDQNKQGQNESSNTNISTIIMFMACTSPLECNISQEIPCDICYLDLGCSNHMTWDLDLFSSLDELIQDDVTHFNNIEVIVLGKGTVEILTKKGEQKIMQRLKHNLMGIGQMV